MNTKRYQIKPGARWFGWIDVEGQTPAGEYIVQFEAEDPNSVYERFVYDRTTMSRVQLEAWVGPLDD